MSIDYLHDNIYNKVNHYLVYENIVNISKFTIGFSSLCAYLYYNLINEQTLHYECIIQIVGLYAFIDFFATKSYESKLHHLFVCIFTFYNYYYNIDTNDKFIVLYPMLNTEISSLFYILKYWLRQNTLIYNINLALFYITFFNFRIYKFYELICLIYTPSFYIICQKYSESIFYVFILLGCNGLFVMNIYWFTIMNKIVYKNLLKNVIDTDINCRYICSYIYIINLGVALYMYKINSRTMYDIIGITILAISSNIYHYNIYTNLLTHKIEDVFPTKDNVVLYTNDILCIHGRYFLAIITICYKYNIYIYISATIHFISFYTNIINVLYLLKDHKHKKIYMYYHNLALAFPYVYDSYLFCIMNSSKVVIPFLFINTIIVLVWTIEPFYKMTHILFHICLIAQTYYVCLSNY
jgi:hypothetical protein